jgi:orotate phosphoribosyltransferase
MMDLLAAVPARPGHFLLESGYHTDLWLLLDALFVDPAKVAPLVDALADRLRPHSITAVCGAMVGGALLGQALATTLRVRSYYTEHRPAAQGDGLFAARYELPSAQRGRLRGERVAVVDDVISAGSSVRATVSAIEDAGASTVVVAALAALGHEGVAHFRARHIPVELLAQHEFTLYAPAECPLCRQGLPLEVPHAD